MNNYMEEEAAYPGPVSPQLPAAGEDDFFDLWYVETLQALIFSDIPEE